MNVRKNETVTHRGKKYRVIGRLNELFAFHYVLKRGDVILYLERKSFERKGQKEKKQHGR